jgi:hypothetical protein
VADHVQFSNDTIHLNIAIYRSVHDCEVEWATSFLNLFYTIRLIQGSEDKICWIPSKRRMYEVKSLIMRFAPYW